MVDRAALEMRNTGNRIGGSNPSLSAILSAKMLDLKYDPEVPYGNPQIGLQTHARLLMMMVWAISTN